MRKLVTRSIAAGCALFLFAVFVFASVPESFAAGEIATLSPQEEQALSSIVEQTATSDGVAISDVAYTASNVYLLNGDKLGFVAELNFGDTQGYAIVSTVENSFNPVEISLEKYSPFYNKKGTYIYPSLGKYIIKYNGAYYDLTSGEDCAHLTNDPSGKFHAAAQIKGERETVTKTKVYSYGYSSSYEIPGFSSRYRTSLTTHNNNCANAAGLILLNYWNRYYSNDIVKTSHLDADGNFDDDFAVTVMNTFYTCMRTNVPIGTGTLPENFYYGFSLVVNQFGYKMRRQKDITHSYDEVTAKLSANIPLVITSTDYYFTNLGISLPDVSKNEPMTIRYNHYSGLANAHTFIGYGYVTYDLYSYVSSGDAMPYAIYPGINMRRVHTKIRLIKVADGWGHSRYFNRDLSGIYEASSVEVYK